MPDIVTLGTSINALQHDRCGLGTDPPTGQNGVGKRGKAVSVSSGKLWKTAEKPKILFGEKDGKVHYSFLCFFKGEFGRVLLDFLILVGFHYDS